MITDGSPSPPPGPIGVVFALMACTCLPRISEVSVHVRCGDGARQVGGDDTMPSRVQHRHHSAPDHARGTGHQQIHIPATTIPFVLIGFPGVGADSFCWRG